MSILRPMTAFLISFFLTLVLGRILIPILRRLKAGQAIKEDGPTWHMGKQGTPTMGGIMFILGTTAALVVLGYKQLLSDPAPFFVLAFALLFGGIGFLDDYAKVKKRQNTGLTAAQKFLLQLAAAIAFTTLLRYTGYVTPNLFVPFLNVTLPLPWPLFMVFAAFVMVGTVNAVNITDGVDGLAASVTLPVMVFFSAVALAWGNGYGTLGLLAAALAGGLIAFLFYNFHPAKVFMGDTGSLFLGGMVCGLAFAYDMPLILVPIGVIYVAETLSDIIQVVYFKATHGKRFFKMAPLHHHFELCGWSELKVVGIFSFITLAACLAAYAGVFDRFLR